MKKDFNAKEDSRKYGFEDRGFGTGRPEKGGFWKDLKGIRSVGEAGSFAAKYSDRLRLLIFPVLAAIIILSLMTGGKGGDVYVDEGVGAQASVSEDGDADVSGSGSEEGGAGGGGAAGTGGAGVGTESGASSDTVIYVDISGEVVTPGVYELPKGTRLFQLIERAGGLTAAANRDMINQASTVSDGQKIIIRSCEETEGMSYGEGPASVFGGGAGGAGGYAATGADGGGDSEGSKININTASAKKLQEIPGIGPSKAESIIAYREAHGAFKSIEDIKNVNGIGSFTYQSIMDHITV